MDAHDWLAATLAATEEPPLDVHVSVWWEWWAAQPSPPGYRRDASAHYAEWKARRAEIFTGALQRSEEWKATPHGQDFARRRAEEKRQREAQKVSGEQKAFEVERDRNHRLLLSQLPECAGAVWMSLEDEQTRRAKEYQASVDPRILDQRVPEWEEKLAAIRATWWQANRRTHEEAVLDNSLATHIYGGRHGNDVLAKAAGPSLIPEDMWPPPGSLNGLMLGCWAVLVLDPYLTAHPEIPAKVAWAQFDLRCRDRNLAIPREAAQLTLMDKPTAMSMESWEGLWEQAWPALSREAQNLRAAARGQRIQHSLWVLLDRDGPACKLCGEEVDPSDIHIDHVVPFARGGIDAMVNLQIACSLCNLSKSDDWAGSLDHARLDAALAASPTYTGPARRLAVVVGVRSATVQLLEPGVGLVHRHVSRTISVEDGVIEDGSARGYESAAEPGLIPRQ